MSKKVNLLLIFYMLMLVSSSIVLGVKSYEKITLLTVSKTNEGLIGGTVDMEIRIIPGSGNIFIDTYPLSRLDTIESIRLANREACRYSPVNCNDYDFFYTIKTTTPIVGGPSAGGFIAITTLAMLRDKEVRNDLAMTGTIMSGGVIGIVDGIPEKIEAAERKGKNIVLIPALALCRNNTNLTNISFMNNSNIRVIPINNILEGFRYATGESIDIGNISVDPSYTKVMNNIANDLCERTKSFIYNITNSNLSIVLDNINLYRGDLRTGLEKFNESLNTSGYVKASLCFSANIYLDKYILNNSVSNISKQKDDLLNEISFLREKIDSLSINTINDLQTIMVVKDRLYDAEDSLKNCNSSCIYELAYSRERLFSAREWLKMYGLKSKKISIDKDFLKVLATKKILEAEEKLQYLDALTFSSINLSREEKDLMKARTMLNSDPDLSLYIASRITAEINALSSMNKNSCMDLLAREKLRAAKNFIAFEQEKGFPFMGYSYYSYGNYLSNKDPLSGLIYAEYSLEFGSMNQYFPEKRIRINYQYIAYIFIFLLGLSIGLLSCMIKNSKRRPGRNKSSLGKR